MRLELEKLLTKQHVEKKSVTFTGETSKVDGPWRDLSGTSARKSISELPEATCEILDDDCEGIKKGDVVIGDPVSQYLMTLGPGDETLLLSDSLVTELLAHSLEGRGDEREVVVLHHLLEINERGVSCWMCFDCLKCLQYGILPKGVLANDLWIGNIPSQLIGLMILEQLLITQHYPQC